MIKKFEKVLICILCALFILALGGLLLHRHRSAPQMISLENLPQVTSPGVMAGGLMNINKASAEQLEELPGIGPALSQRIVAYRQENGNFKTIDELLNVKGIGPKKLASMEPYITTGGTP